MSHSITLMRYYCSVVWNGLDSDIRKYDIAIIITGTNIRIKVMVNVKVGFLFVFFDPGNLVFTCFMFSLCQCWLFTKFFSTFLKYLFFRIGVRIVLQMVTIRSIIRINRTNFTTLCVRLYIRVFLIWYILVWRWPMVWIIFV